MKKKLLLLIFLSQLGSEYFAFVIFFTKITSVKKVTGIIWFWFRNFWKSS